MKKLREGVSTGSCMTGGAEASVIWQTTGKCPSVVKVDTPIGKTLYLDIIPREFGVCGVIKDAGDDPDVTNGSEIVTKVELFEEEGDIFFFGGEGVWFAIPVAELLGLFVSIFFLISKHKKYKY